MGRARDPFSLLTGVLLDLRLELITSHLLSFLEGILLKFKELYVCFQIPLLLLKLGHVSTTSLILCTPREHSYIGMLERAWRKESFLKPVRIWPHWRRIMKKLGWILGMLKGMREMNIDMIPTNLVFK